MIKIPSGYSQGFFDDSETLDEEFVLNALLRHNFLPNQKSDSDELPHVFSSTSFTVDVAKKLHLLQEKRGAGFPGYDAVVYKLTRFNGVPRVCSIPHPKAYARLALTIGKNWQNLKYVSENENSRIVPKRHEDGRLVIMDYENRVSTSEQTMSASFGKRFMVKTDISNCYPSIYSHSVPWAVAGLDEAKKNRTKNSKWYNKLDKALQYISRNETNGIPIGPGTSNIISEAILARVDNELRAKFTYHRYMDDYTAYCESHEEAEKFVFTLAKELAKYKLTLNAGKTATHTFPTNLTSDWVVELRNGLPKQTQVTAFDTANYMDNVVRVAKHNPDGNVVKYGLKTLTSVLLDSQNEEVDAEVIRNVLAYATNLSFHHPILVPLLEPLFDKHLSLDGEFKYNNELQAIVCENVRLNRSDAISWGLFLAKKYGVSIRECCYNQIIQSQDCVPILLMYLTGEQEQKDAVVAYAENLDPEDLYGIDQYWLLLYQLFKDGAISDPYSCGSSNTTSFSIMKSSGVNFIENLPVT